MEDTQFNEQLRIPKIRALYLVIWLGLAVALVAIDATISAMQMRALQKATHISLLVPWWTHLARAFAVAAFAACLVGSYVLVQSRRFRVLSRLQPGHWLVLLLALGGILASIAVPFEWVAASESSSPSCGRWGCAVLVLSSLLVVGVSYGFAVVRLRDAKRWRVILVFGLADAFLGIILSAPRGMSGALHWSGVSPWLGPCWWILLVLVAMAVVTIDVRCRINRDWLHWLGVSLWTLGSARKLLLAIVAIVIAQRGLLDTSGTQVRLGGLPNGLPYERLGWDADGFFTDQGVLSLCRAIEGRNLREIERLVKSGVDVNARGRGNMTPLLWAFPMGEEVFAKVLELGGDPNIKLTETRLPPVFVKGRSVMSLAASPTPVVCAWGDIPTNSNLKLVLEHGGDPNIEDLDGNTPLFYLTDDSHELRARIRLLLDAGADVNHRNKRGITPLISWYCSTKKGSVLRLLEAGADYRIADNNGLDFVLYVASAMHFYRKDNKPDDRIAKAEIATIDWLTNEGVNWDVARAALGDKELMKNVKNLPTDYKHRPWLPQHPAVGEKGPSKMGPGTHGRSN